MRLYYHETRIATHILVTSRLEEDRKSGYLILSGMVLGVDTNLNAIGKLLSQNDISSDTNTFITNNLARDLILFPQYAHSNYKISNDISIVT